MFGASVVEDLSRGCMVRIQGLVSKPELNGAWALVLGPQTEAGRWPTAVAPVLPTEPLTRLAVKPANLVPAPQSGEALGRAWNNLAYAFKRTQLYWEAGKAYETSLAYAPPEAQAPTLSNMVKLCMELARVGEATRDETQQRMTTILNHLFAPITSLSELRGLDCSYGCDFVPGYDHRMLYCGITHSVEGVPARTGFARMWVFDDDIGALVELEPETGRTIPMSDTARRAIAQGLKGEMVTDAQNCIFSGGSGGAS